MGDYLTTLENMLATAESRVDIVVPFIDPVGASILGDAYDRARRAVPWSIYVRTCPRELAQLGKDRGWTVHEFIAAGPGDNARGFHCKIFLVDDARAVVGSANLVYTNLAENVEIGVYLETADEVRPLLAVPRALARGSRLVNYSGMST